MIVATLKILVAIYGFTKLVGAKDPTKSLFDSIDFKANSFLDSLKNQSVTEVLWRVSKFLFWINIGLFCIFIIGLIAFKPLPKEFVISWAFSFSSSTLLNISIPWNLDHTRYLRSFFKSPMMIVPASPILGLILRFLLGPGPDLLQPFKSLPFGIILFNALGGNDWLFASSLSAIFFVVYIVIPYLLFWVIFLPIFYTFMSLTYAMQLMLRMVHKYLNENLLAVLMGILAIILAPL